MKLDTIKKDGWKITHDTQKFYLTINPGVLTEIGVCYLVDEEIYNSALSSSLTIEELVSRFNIFSNYEKLYELKKPPQISIPPNTDIYYNNGDLIVTDESGRYFIKYQLSRHGGGIRKFEISKEIYLEARTGNYTTTELFKKYDLYRFDIPENDVK